MKLLRRRHGSQRSLTPVPLRILNYNTAGQGGDNQIVLYDEGQRMYYILEMETELEWREMLSAVQKASHHIKKETDE